MERGRKFSRSTAVLVLAALVSLVCESASANQVLTLTLNAGEAYVIQNVDANAAPRVSFADNPNSFTVKSTGPHSLTVFSFQPGEGSLDTKIAGEDVTYHIIVSGIANPGHPLRPGAAPPALSGAGHSETPAPAPYAPASAAVAAAPRPAAGLGPAAG